MITKLELDSVKLTLVFIDLLFSREKIINCYCFSGIVVTTAPSSKKSAGGKKSNKGRQPSKNKAMREPRYVLT